MGLPHVDDALGRRCPDDSPFVLVGPAGLPAAARLQADPEGVVDSQCSEADRDPLGGRELDGPGDDLVARHVGPLPDHSLMQN